jgi:hypothetical protein
MKLRLILISFFLTSTAMAYVPPASFILTHALKDRKGLSSVEWSAKVTQLKSQAVFKENLRVDFASGRIQIQYLSPNDEVLGGIHTTLNELHGLGKVWLLIGMDPNSARVRNALTEMSLLPKLDTEARLTREGSRVAWTWGSGALIHFLKDEFYPISYESGSAPTDDQIVFESFASTGAQVHVPKSVKIRAESIDAYRFDLKSVKVDVASKTNYPQGPINSIAVKEWVSLVR